MIFRDIGYLAERYAVKAVFDARCEKRLDAVLGFADAYSLATVAKITAEFGEGIPVLSNFIFFVLF